MSIRRRLAVLCMWHSQKAVTCGDDNSWITSRDIHQPSTCQWQTLPLAVMFVPSLPHCTSDVDTNSKGHTDEQMLNSIFTAYPSTYLKFFCVCQRKVNCSQEVEMSVVFIKNLISATSWSVFPECKVSCLQEVEMSMLFTESRFLSFSQEVALFPVHNELISLLRVCWKFDIYIVCVMKLAFPADTYRW